MLLRMIARLTVQPGSTVGFCWMSVSAGFDGSYLLLIGSFFGSFNQVGLLCTTWDSVNWELQLSASVGFPQSFPTGNL